MNLVTKLLAVGALLLGISGVTLAESESPLVIRDNSNVQQYEDVLFTFMRKSQLLPVLADLADQKPHFRQKEIKAIKELPFRELFHDLQNKMEELSRAEGKQARESGTFDENALKQRFDDAKSSATDLHSFFLNLYEVIKDFPAIREGFTLASILAYDSVEILQDLLDHKIDPFSSNFVKEFTELLSKQENPQDFLGLTKVIFNDEMEQYKAFVEENKKTLEMISAISKKGFRITRTSKTCRKIRGKELCTSGKYEYEIKTISEIMPYIQSLEASPAIKAPRSDL